MAEPRFGVINSAWLSLSDGRMDAEFWLNVHAQLKAAGVEEPRLATLDQVKAAIAACDAADRATEAQVRQLRAEAQSKLEEARTLERTLPRYPVRPDGPRNPVRDRGAK